MYLYIKHATLLELWIFIFPTNFSSAISTALDSLLINFITLFHFINNSEAPWDEQLQWEFSIIHYQVMKCQKVRVKLKAIIKSISTWSKNSYCLFLLFYIIIFSSLPLFIICKVRGWKGNSTAPRKRTKNHPNTFIVISYM